MNINDRLVNYSKYLTYMSKKLEGFFEAQSPYIFCQKGCAHCCKKAEFPYSEIEFQYLILGSLKLNTEQKAKVEQNIAQIIENKKKNTAEKFYYDCPFLLDNVCCVYEHRGIVCRSFGILENNEGGKTKIPFCHSMGLNYSNVVDEEKLIISEEKYLALNEPKSPFAYNINYNFLTNEAFEEIFNFKFGEKKPLIDWFEVNQ